MNVLIEMTALSVGRPGAGSSADEVAAWFQAKARLHEHLAAQGGPDALRESALAASAYQRSFNLLRQAA
jgi:hypothetical protein